jgi:hypothetical protein
MTPAKTDATHVVLRYADSVLGLGGTIRAHKAVLGASGRVLFGKMGRPVGAGRVAALNAQIESGTETFLMLVGPAQNQLSVTRGRLSRVLSELTSDDAALVPPYYRELGITRQMSSWFELTALTPGSDEMLKRLNVAKTGTPILSIVSSSRSPLFFARLRSGAQWR